MAVAQKVTKVKIQTQPLNPGDTPPASYEAQLQAALDAQTAFGDWKIVHILEHNVSAQYAELILVFEESS